MTNQWRRQAIRGRALVRACAFVSVCTYASCAGAQPAIAQEVSAPDATQERVVPPRDGTYLTPSEGRVERTISWLGSKFENPSEKRDGFYPELGLMITGAGLSAGAGFRHHAFGDRAVVDVSAAMSWKRYRAMNAQLAFPRLMNDRLSVGAQVRYQDFTRINFFGIGSESLESDRTDYRLKNVDALGFASLRLKPWLSITGRAGVLRGLDIESGTSAQYPPIGERFDEISAPGLMHQPTYLHGDIALDADTRDVPGYPSSGGRYRLSLAAYRDRSFSRYSFRRIEADGAHHVPLGRTVLSLHGRLDVSQDAGQDIPFYLLPSLGGLNSLRGYADYRFRDRHLLMVNAEYRFPLVKLVDAAVFYDAGTVAATAGALTHRPRTDYGVGVRVHSSRHMLVRLDVARGSEGTRTLVSFTTPLAPPSRTVVPYVP